jgi:DNA-binding FrmR family transcriptional regulator
MNNETRSSTLTRLRRIEGQVRGLQRMVEEERPCAEIVNQVASVEQALSGVTKLLLTSHLRHCAAKNPQAVDDVVTLISKHWR